MFFRCLKCWIIDRPVLVLDKKSFRTVHAISACIVFHTSQAFSGACRYHFPFVLLSIVALPVFPQFMSHCPFVLDLVAHIDQLTRIMSLVGTPSPELLAKITSEEVSTNLAMFDNYQL